MYRKNKNFLSYAEASEAVKKMGVTDTRNYAKRYKEIPGLPCSPAKFYDGEYRGWDAFCGITSKYSTAAEAGEAVRRLGIKTFVEYLSRYKEDPRLPSQPNEFYGESYIGFSAWSSRIQPVRYSTIELASEAAIRIGLHSSDDYCKRYKEDPLLPSNPQKHYSKEWSGWPFFLKIDNLKAGKGKYETYEEFISAVRRMGISSRGEYLIRYKEDSKFSSHPESLYKKCWTKWKDVFETDSYIVRCSTWQEAKTVAEQYRFTTSLEYRKGCSVDARLPKWPNEKYKNFPGWIKFLLPERYNCLDDVRCAVKILGINSSVKYKNFRKKYPFLPAHPHRKFADEWVDWYELCDIPRNYSYEELQKLVSSYACTTVKEYRELWVSLKDPSMPSSPDEVYPEWSNWNVFLDKPYPYTLEYIQGCGVGWVPSIQRFLKKVRGRGGKETSICRFIRHFIEPMGLDKTPRDFLTRKGLDIKPFKVLMDKQVNSSVARGLLFTVNSFLNEILRSELTIEDEETGELVRVDGANNPFATMEYNSSGKPGPTESTKPALAFQYVDSMKKWMVSESAANFSDLKNLHQFDSDYVEVDEDLIDRSDPDCVFKIKGEKYQLWCPVNWMLAYSLVSVPARGRQIAYNDSGESDEYIVDIVDEKLVWVKNESFLARHKNQQAFIKRCEDNSWGMHFTSNKTSYGGLGYDVPWAPEKLIYWMLRLRKWQNKYNPIKRAMPWSECTRTSLNEAQLRRKGANCFLFRAFREEQPGSYKSQLAERLAATLYFTQPRNIILATFRKGGSLSLLSRYESVYTPHSMRVSLITAYVMEFGLPIEVIMKLAGHASVVMSIYYVKVSAAFLRRRMDEGEKLALRDGAYVAQEMLEQNRLNELTHELVANSEQALQVLKAGNVGSTLVRDYGLCPYGAARCDDGGSRVGETLVWSSVPAGFLGMQNCLRCRHFITGPMFLGGMLALWNAISLELNLLSKHYLDFEIEIDSCVEKIQKMDELEYDLEKSGCIFDSRERNFTELQIRKLQSEKESIAKKMDMFFCDLQMLTKQINECKKIVSLQDGKDEIKVQLVVHEQNEIKVEIEQTSMFQQLNEVCMNASIFQSVSAASAIPRRSQMIDRVALFNKIQPAMCCLSEKEQLAMGNQVTKFLLQRLKTWERVDQLIDCHILLEDLGDAERISKEEISQLLTPKAPQLINLKEFMV